MRKFYELVWNASEFTGIPLGRFAPKVFERMIDRKGELIDE